MGVAPLRLGTTEHARTGADGRPALRIGSTTRPLPRLSAPVGPESLRPRYPGLNAAADLALVDAAFRDIVALQPSTAGRAPGNLLALADAVRGYQTDRLAAIRKFQSLEDIRDDQERQAGAIKSDGLTWQTLWTYAELARDLTSLRDRQVNPTDYIHRGRFDPAVFRAEADRLFAARTAPDEGRYNANSVPDMLDLLSRCAHDPRVIDIRWIAYMLATALWETSTPHSVEPNANGVGTHEESRWAKPNREDGRGDLGRGRPKLDYYLPVKVARAPGGGAVVTEQDGQIFDVGADGRFRARTPGGIRGTSAPRANVASAYAQATGAEFAYYGRGYCHLTWWDGYASTSVEIGLGLELLFNPDRALERQTAFEVMVHGMVYGLGFAHGQRLQMYLDGAKTDYVGARRIVNGTNKAVEIGKVAKLFETALLRSRL